MESSMQKDLLQYVSIQVLQLKRILESASSNIPPFHISVVDLMDAYPDTAQALLASPLTLLPVLKAAIIESQLQLRSILTLPSTASVKRSPIVRFHHLPPIPTLLRPYLSALKAEDTQRLLQVHGTVVKTNAVKMLEVSRIYTCLRNHCDHRFKVTADPEQDHLMEQPLSCPVLLDPVLGPVCGSKSVREIEGTKECIDYQEIRIQDRMDALPFGALPRSLNVILESDLVDSLNPGDDVEVIGVLYRQWKPVRIGVKCEATLAFKAFGVRVLNQFNSFRLYKSVQECKENFNLFWERLQDNKVAGRDALVRLVCPQLYGLYFVKLAVLLTVLGGSATVKSEGVQSRSNCHILLVGDPGTGKSQLLTFFAGLMPRAVQTTGVGTTGAGLTCTAVRTGNEWSLEAGALVLASGGVCCIDEFASMRESDRATIHEAMEQQTISVAKAGLVVKLDTKCSILAACNAKGSGFDPSLDLSANTTIGPALISRFDLVLVMLDRPQKEWDMKVSTYLLKQAVGGVNDPELSTSCPNTLPEGFLREYVLYARELNPQMSDGAQQLLTRFYQLQRQGDEKTAMRSTVRLLESLLRLSEAHAKLMLHQEVTLQDAVMAIQCVQVSQLASEASLLSSDSLLQSDFPEDSTAFYDALEANILRKLHLSPVDYKALQSSSKGKSQPAPTVALPSSTLTASNTFYSDDRTPLKRSWSETVFSPPEKRSTERKRLACRPESVTKVSLSRDDLQHLRDVVPASPRIDLQEISFPSKKMSAGLFVVEQIYPAPLDEEKMESFDGMNGATFHHPDTFHRPNTNISKNFTFSDDIILEDW